MTSHGPEQAIIDDLCHPRLTSSGIGPAIEETIHFLREYSLSHRQVHLVTYEDINGRMLEYIVDVSQIELGNWQVNGSSGFLHEEFLRKEASYSFPWVRIFGNGWEI